jgi:uncharacterized protein YuzE
MRSDGLSLSRCPAKLRPAVNAAYVYLGGGEAATSVTLDECPEAEDVEALHSIVLDFVRDGRLIGVEVLAAQQTLNPRILRTD